MVKALTVFVSFTLSRSLSVYSLDFKEQPYCTFIGQCVDAENSVSSPNLKITNKNDFDSDECINMCMSVPGATACQWRDNGQCVVHKGDVISSNGKSTYQCSIFKECKSKEFCKTLLLPLPDKRNNSKNRT